MKWKPGIKQPYHQTEEGTARAHDYYYIYRMDAGKWRAGRWMFNHDVDFRIEFSSAKVARDYLEMYDREAVLITAM